MPWSNKELGSLLIGAGLIFLVIGLGFSTQMMSIVGFRIGGMEASLAGVTPPTATSVFIGIVLLGTGIYLRRR